MAAAECIHADGVDILIDLNSHTKGVRFEILAHRPAPVQAVWFGFPGTSGADFIDYLIIDPVSAPEAVSRHFSEAPVYLPHCHQPYDDTQEVTETGTTRADQGLPENAVVFCSFNQLVKMEPVMFDCWMRILGQVQNSVLWLPVRDQAAQERLRNRAGDCGVDPDRLVFARRTDTREEHLERLRLADIALDTRIWGGHTTTSDALLAGIPVITHQGGHVASRISTSILHAAGMAELAVDGLKAYEALAVRLAGNAEERKRIREKIARNRETEPLFDTPRFVHHLETAFEAMWQRFRDGEKPAAIVVPDTEQTGRRKS